MYVVDPTASCYIKIHSISELIHKQTTWRSCSPTTAVSPAVVTQVSCRSYRLQVTCQEETCEDFLSEIINICKWDHARGLWDAQVLLFSCETYLVWIRDKMKRETDKWFGVIDEKAVDLPNHDSRLSKQNEVNVRQWTLSIHSSSSLS